MSRRLFAPANLALLIGCVALALPTMLQVARDSWSTEQGGHGPLVLATGLWALWRELKAMKAEPRPGKLVPSLLGLAVSLGIFILARITGILEIEAFAMYGALVTAAYLLVGPAVIRSIWFPLVYLAFTLPSPSRSRSPFPPGRCRCSMPSAIPSPARASLSRSGNISFWSRPRARA